MSEYQLQAVHYGNRTTTLFAYCWFSHADLPQQQVQMSKQMYLDRTKVAVISPWKQKLDWLVFSEVLKTYIYNLFSVSFQNTCWMSLLVCLIGSEICGTLISLSLYLFPTYDFAILVFQRWRFYFGECWQLVNQTFQFEIKPMIKTYIFNKFFSNLTSFFSFKSGRTFYLPFNISQIRHFQVNQKVQTDKDKSLQEHLVKWTWIVHHLWHLHLSVWQMIPEDLFPLQMVNSDVQPNSDVLIRRWIR